MKKPALFLDRDGVINVDYGHVHKREQFHFIDGIFDVVRQANLEDFLVVIVTNQAGIGRGLYSDNDFHILMDWVKEQFVENGAKIDAVYYCPYHSTHGIGRYKKESECRKPKPGMLLQAAKDMNIDLQKSIIIGDKETDIKAGQAANVGNLFLLSKNNIETEACVFNSLHDFSFKSIF